MRGAYAVTTPRFCSLRARTDPNATPYSFPDEHLRIIWILAKPGSGDLNLPFDLTSNPSQESYPLAFRERIHRSVGVNRLNLTHGGRHPACLVGADKKGNRLYL